MKCLLILALLGAVFSTVELGSIISCQPMNYPVIIKKAIRRDCLKDYPKPDRLLPKYTLTARENGLVNVPYVGPIDWGIAYATFLPEFICKCAVRALELEHRFFGIQFFGECWSAENVGKPKTHVTDCVNGNFVPCKKKDKFCTGKHWVNQVYAFKKKWFKKNKGKTLDCNCTVPQQPYCDGNMEDATLKYCLKDYPTPRRLLPKYALTAREDGLRNVPYVGPIDWANYAEVPNGKDGFLKEFICECAKKACKLKHKFFGIQFYGECWSANKVGDPQIPVDNCVNGKFQPCNLKKEKFCTGRRWANAVYEFDKDWFDQNCIA